MKKNLMLFLCTLLLASVGCTGSQDIVEPDRDGLITGDVEYTDPTMGGKVVPE